MNKYIRPWYIATLSVQLLAVILQVFIARQEWAGLFFGVVAMAVWLPLIIMLCAACLELKKKSQTMNRF